MNPFEYASPTSLDDAIDLLSDRWGPTELLAGGTDLVTALKQNIVAPRRLVSLKSVPDLDRIRSGRDAVRIGAMARLADVAENEAVREKFPSIVTAIEGIGSPQMLAMGTVGGDLCQRPRCWYFRQGFGLLGRHQGAELIPHGENRYHAIFDNGGPAYFVNPSSLAPALTALGASVVASGTGGRTRQIAMNELYRNPQGEGEREITLRPNEVITEIVIPDAGLANATYEVRQRQGLDWPLVTASVAFRLREVAREPRVVLGHVAPMPHSANAAAAALDGKSVNAAIARRAGEAATEGATPLSGNAYKVPLVVTAVKRAALAAAGVEEG